LDRWVSVDKKGARRQPIAPDILRLIKARINENKLGLVDNRMLWAAAAVMFFGALSGDELLCRGAGQFDPAYALCTQDIVVQEGSVGEKERKKERMKHLFRTEQQH
jgi:hypothetical protein